MEIAQLYKSAFNNQLHKRNMSQIWKVNILWQGQS